MTNSTAIAARIAGAKLPPETTREGLTHAERNGLRWIAGIGHAWRDRDIDADGEPFVFTVPARLFPPGPEVIDRLLAAGLIETHPERDGEYRPSFAGVQLLPKIGAAG